MATISLNILCVFTIERAAVLPLCINMALNSGYFLLLVAMSTVVAYYLLQLVLEHVYRSHCMHRAVILLLLLFLLYAAAIFYNLFSGVVFSFDAQFNYRRGPLINLGYLIMAGQLAIILICTFRNHCSISQPIRRVMRVLPPTVILLTLYQLAYPDVLFNGSIIVAADLILLLNFQSRRLEVDSLTCINNRTSFYHELKLRLAGRQHFQVVIVALRQFTYVNQHFGNPFGDALLYEIACWLDRLHRQGRAFRVGNVEFALLVPYNGVISSEELFSQVCQRFRQAWVLGENQITLETHMAEIIHTDQDWSATDVLEFLRFSLRLAGERDERIIRYDRETFLRLEERRHILQLTRKAVQDRSFQVWYQPIYNCREGRFSSAEALLRLRDEQGKLVSTDLLISLAEESGMLSDLSWIVLEEVCRLLGSGQVPQLQSISVNLSMQQFMSDELIQRLQDYLSRYKVDPCRLKIEITERVLGEDTPRIRSTMQALTAIGIHFHLDDFGVGYSNLSTVLGLPFSCIKLDRSLIQPFPEEQKSSAIVDTMLDLFHSLGCQVVAEGVETAVQANALTAWGADWLQGYFCARPMPQDELIPFLQSCAPHTPDQNP